MHLQLYCSLWHFCCFCFALYLHTAVYCFIFLLLLFFNNFIVRTYCHVFTCILFIYFFFIIFHAIFCIQQFLYLLCFIYIILAVVVVVVVLVACFYLSKVTGSCSRTARPHKSTSSAGHFNLSTGVECVCVCACVHWLVCVVGGDGSSCQLCCPPNTKWNFNWNIYF